MTRFGIKVEETLSRTVIVEAEDLDEAMEKVREAVKSSEIILDADDYVAREIEPCDNFVGGIVPNEADVSFYWHLRADRTL